MGRRFYDADADPTLLAGQTIAVVGYGNQGRAQCLNLRDSGVHVIVGNINDAYRDQAERDDFHPTDISVAVDQADVVFLLIPDEDHQAVYRADVHEHLKPNSTLVFAHGYSIHYGLIEPPPTVDVILVAPKMIGEGVRRLFVNGKGFPTLIGVAHNPSGTALDTAVSLAHALGGTRHGAWLSSFEEETVTDLFGEQVAGASMIGSMMMSFDTLVEAGYDPEIVQLELYGSGELVEEIRAVQRYGLLNQLPLHSRTSQYGQLSRISRLVPESTRETLRQVLGDIRSGDFAREWAQVQIEDPQEIENLNERYAKHPLFGAEKAVRVAYGETLDVMERADDRRHASGDERLNKLG